LWWSNTQQANIMLALEMAGSLQLNPLVSFWMGRLRTLTQIRIISIPLDLHVKAKALGRVAVECGRPCLDARTNHHVVWLDVAVNNAIRVTVIKRLQQLE